MTALDERNESETAQEEHYAYQLVKFFTTNKDGVADIDCVPSTWVTFNVTTGKCETKYVPPPYNKDSFELLHDFVKKQVLPPENWPSHPITIQGHARNYADALERLEILQQEDYAYTTGDNVSKAEKAAATTKRYRTRVVKSNAKVVKKLTRVPEINASSVESCSENASDKSSNVSNKASSGESEDDNDDNRTPEKRNWRKAQRNHNKKQNQHDRSDFPCDRNYVREDPPKSLKSAGKEAKLKTSAVKPSASQNIHRSGPTPASPTKLPAAANKESKGSVKLAIDGLRYDVQQLTQELKDLKGIVQKSALAQDVYGANVQGFASEYEVSLPMKTMEDFKAFERRLEIEKIFRKEFTASLHYLVDSRSTVSKNITGILKKHLTRELALNFTAVKASGTKTIFKHTFFCECMLEVSRLKLKVIEKDNTVPITEKLFYHELGNALTNAFDWDGKRKERPKRKAAAVNPAEREVNEVVENSN